MIATPPTLPELSPTPEPAVPSPRRRRRILVAGVTLAAVLGAAVTFGGDDGPEPLALVAGNAAGDGSAADARLAAPESAGDGAFAASDAKMTAPGWGGMEFDVDPTLPALDGEAAAWRFRGGDLDADEAARIAGLLGFDSRPAARDGGFVIEGDGGYFGAWPGSDGWSVSFNQAQPGPGDDIAATGPVSAGRAERVARDLLGRLGVTGDWEARTYATETGFGWACAEDVARMEELKASEGGITHGDTPVADGAPPTEPDGSSPSCSPPPPPVPAQVVGFRPVLDGVTAEWESWSVTVRGDDRIESLYGTFATFEKVGNYPLRGTAAGLDELRDQNRAIAMPMPFPAPMPGDPGPARPKCPPEADCAFAAGSVGSAEPAVAPAPPETAVECMTYEGPQSAPCPAPTMPPVPADCGPDADCAAPVPSEPVRVRITGVERTLVMAPVWKDGREHMHLVPGYRFTGTFEDSSPWEMSTVALHPDVVTPPPGDFPGEPTVVDGGGGAPAVGVSREG